MTWALRLITSEIFAASIASAWWRGRCEVRLDALCNRQTACATQADIVRVNEPCADLGSPQKVLVDLGCASHNAMWERNHTLLFRASLEWLDKGTLNGMQQAS